MQVTRDHVIWAYRILLERDPENEAMIQHHLNAGLSISQLRRNILISPEYKTKALCTEGTGRIALIKPLDKRLRLYIDICDPSFSAAAVINRYEPHEISFVQEHVRLGQNVLDLGANVGLYTVIMADLVGPNGHVHAFEPLRENTELLRLSLEENKFTKRVTIHEMAVSNACGSQFFHVEPGKRASSCLSKEEEAITVQTVTLDTCPLRRPVHFIKVDIEGAELLAFQGATSLLVHDKPLIMSEINPSMLASVSGCTPQEYINFICGFGYTCEEWGDWRSQDHITAIFRPVT